MKAKEIIKKYFFYSISTGFLVGIISIHFDLLPVGYSPLFLWLGSSVLLYSILLINIKNEASASFFILAIFILMLSFGQFRYISFNKDSGFLFQEKIGQKVSLKGQIVNYPEKRKNGQRAILLSGNNRILIYADYYPELQYGDYLQVEGRLDKPKEFETGPGKIFDYPNYLKKDRIFYTLSFGKVEILNRGNGNFLKEKLYSIKRKSISGIEKVLPSPESSLLAGILLGLPDSSGYFDEDFRKTGLSHITVLSGYNIAVIYLASIFILSFLSYRFKFLLAGGFVILFTIMVSSGSATWRAAIMALVVVMGKLLFKRISVWRSLYLAGLLMIIWNPLALFYDPGFQLSFLATLGIIGISRDITTKIKFIPTKMGLRETIAVSLAAQALVLPLVIYNSGEFSTFSILANILVLPAVAPAMLFGFIALIIGFLPGPIYLLPSLVADFLLKYILLVAHSLSSLPGSVISLPVSSLIFINFIYILIFSIIFMLYKKRARARLESLLGEINIISDVPYSQNLQPQSPN